MVIDDIENEDGEFVPKTENTKEKEKKLEKPKRTKEELAKSYSGYLKLVDEVYPLKEFELKGKDGEILNFYRGSISINEPEWKCYDLRDKEYKQAYEKKQQQLLLGEEWTEDINKAFKSKAFIDINTEEKYFNFGTEWEYQRNGYGRAIYDNYLNILEMLGIENKEQYELRVYGNANHEFLQGMQTEKLVSKTNTEPNFEKASQLLEEFAKYPNNMKFSQLNSIIKYAIKSGISIEEITKAINENGFNIKYYANNSGEPKFEREDLEQFKFFGITGIKATSMHQHFTSRRNCGFMKFLGDVEMEDATLEFKNILEYVKKDYELKKAEGSWIPSNLEEFGELGHIILDWDDIGLLLKNVSPEIKEVVKRKAIDCFEEFDPKHKEKWVTDYTSNNTDINSRTTFIMLSQAGMMNKEAYIELYQRALNRNYNLRDFDNRVCSFIDEEERKLAREEIAQNTYYPAPKKEWQLSNTSKRSKEHNIAKVSIPQKVARTKNARELIKAEILNQGIAKRTKIKTTMTGKDENGNPIVVNNLEDWLFGVPGANGNLMITKGNNELAFPPQTPKFAVELLEQTLRNIINPDYGER